MFLWEPRLGAIAELAVAMLSICRRHLIGASRPWHTSDS